jgi:hypothetical protein
MGPPHMRALGSRLQSSMAYQGWVEKQEVGILNKKPNEPAKEIQKTLMFDFNIELIYHAVWKGKEGDLKWLYGDCEGSFKPFFSFKAGIEKRSPGSIVEVDTIEVHGKVYFHKFFMAPKLCIDGSKNGCSPYIRVYATIFNGRWNGSLVAAAALDGHN